jgi:serine-type D-Ala-D-Ala carboxypeptidase (penicillin-binding protein 5/6)
MGHQRPARVFLALLVATAVPLAGDPSAHADGPRPTADPAAPTPTAPYPGGPPQGYAPDGSTVGGERLDTRGLVVTDGAPPPPEEVAASGWLVADADTGAVLAARDPHGRYYPASTLKTLTLLTLAPRLDPERVVTGTVEDEKIEGSRVGLVDGGRYPVRVLFEALIMQSGNDAANALARAAGGTAKTVQLMNRTAEAIGAHDTVAGTPSGLDVAGQSSSPYDLALIFRLLLDDPVTAGLLRTPTARIPAVPGVSDGFDIATQNPLLGTYDGNLGGKTGFTDAARHTFVTAAERDGRRLVVSVMDTERVPLRAADQAALLLDWGFSVPAGTDGVGELADPPDDAVPPALRAGQDPTAAATSPLIPAALAVGAVTIVGATLVGRRRAMRPVPVPRRPSGPGLPSVGPPPMRRAPEHGPMTRTRPTGTSPSERQRTTHTRRPGGP